jgi:hypothetical protein
LSLSAYQRELARMVADPEHRRRLATTPDMLDALSLDGRERRRLLAFARDPGMRLNTVLYRANRLAPIYHALPRTCAALGGGLGELLRDFWSARELEDLQFPNEAARLVAFLGRDRRLRTQRGLGALARLELALYELLLLPRASLRATNARARRHSMLHPLVRAVPVDVEPAALIAVVGGKAALHDLGDGRGGVLLDHRDEPGELEPLSSHQTSWCRAASQGRISAPALSWLAKRRLLATSPPKERLVAVQEL